MSQAASKVSIPLLIQSATRVEKDGKKGLKLDDITVADASLIKLRDLDDELDIEFDYMGKVIRIRLSMHNLQYLIRRFKYG